MMLARISQHLTYSPLAAECLVELVLKKATLAEVRDILRRVEEASAAGNSLVRADVFLFYYKLVTQASLKFCEYFGLIKRIYALAEERIYSVRMLLAENLVTVRYKVKNDDEGFRRLLEMLCGDEDKGVSGTAKKQREALSLMDFEKGLTMVSIREEDSNL
jgi:hypothetical protein